ncbi:CMP-N-acetylneuraminate-beta-1,4-galactoside alpha-2,3-sialyltransferase isoform X7 [Pelodiscus sinensis]
MTSIFPKFSKPAPMFLDDSFKKWARIRDFVPPFGIKGQDNLIKAILSATKDYRLTPALDSLSCRRCVIVGNGGVLANKSLGLKIDDYDVVVRLNSAPVKGFEKDVGGKTTLRITYPEGAIQKLEQYEKDSFFVLAGFKWQDFKWLKYIVYKEKVSASDGFWKSVATRVPREPHEIRILNPYFIQEAAFSFIGLPFNNGLMGRGVEHPHAGKCRHHHGPPQLRRGGRGRVWLRHEFSKRPAALLREHQDVGHKGVVDAQHPAGEGVPAEAGESPRHRRPQQRDLGPARGSASHTPAGEPGRKQEVHGASLARWPQGRQGRAGGEAWLRLCGHTQRLWLELARKDRRRRTAGDRVEWNLPAGPRLTAPSRRLERSSEPCYTLHGST